MLNEAGNVKAEFDYDEFGKMTPVVTGLDRETWISKEKDVESGLGDFGMRKYDEEAGRFMSIDLLFEKYYSWTPYHYSRNNPISLLDPSGLADYYYNA